MKLLLVTRGSQGDIYPYLTLASALMERGHDVTLSLPRLFGKQAEAFGLRYVVQASDDIEGMIEGAGETKQQTRHLLKWVRRVIDTQFEELIPLLDEHDALISANTEFAAASVAEHCRKPLMRTAFAPFLPGGLIPPPVMPWPKPHPLVTPRALWRMLNLSTNFMVLKTLNRNRLERGLPPIRNFGIHAAQAGHNFLMYSRHLGNTDPGWTFRWAIGGYCFHDRLPYEEDACRELTAFIQSDSRPTLFFTLGSCSAGNKDNVCEWLLQICRKHGYKLVVGSGWSGAGSGLHDGEHLFRMDKPVPHSLVFPLCDAVIHHGGCGTTHSVARAGKPQLILPIILDQHYWGNRVHTLGTGPDRLKIGKATYARLESAVCDLADNPAYRANAASLGEKIRGEDGVRSICEYIERTFPSNPVSRKTES